MRAKHRSLSNAAELFRRARGRQRHRGRRGPACFTNAMMASQPIASRIFLCGIVMSSFQQLTFAELFYEISEL